MDDIYTDGLFERFPVSVQLKDGIYRSTKAMLLTSDNVDDVMDWCKGISTYESDPYEIPCLFGVEGRITVRIGEFIVRPLYQQFSVYSKEEFFKLFKLRD